MRKYIAANYDKIRTWRRNGDLKKHFGISLDQYNEMLEAQGFVCAICNLPETQKCSTTGVVYKLAVDHCHKTGKVRALLCSRCNRTLGMVDDDVLLLQKLSAYIQQFTGA